MTNRFTYIFLQHLFLFVALVSGHKSYCQVISFPAEIPSNIKSQYPFISDNFYYIDCEQEDGNTGYFIFLFDKVKLEAFYKTKVIDTLDILLHNYPSKECSFFQDDCWFNLTCNGETVRKIQGQNLRFNSDNMRIKSNFDILQLTFDNTLWGHAKIWSKFTCFNPNPFNWCVKICEDQPTVNTGDFPLVNTVFTNNIWFSPINNSKISISNNVNLFGKILWNQCNKPCSPYTSYSSNNFHFSSETIFDLSEFGSLFNIYMEDSKKIKITEDDNYYYVYCIKKK